MYVDNHASIQTINKSKQQSAQYIIHYILENLEELQRQRPSLEFIIEWIPGHMNIAGNEKVEEEAKRAALEKSIGEQPQSQYKLNSTQLTKINADITIKVKASWNHGKTNARHHRQITHP